MKWTSTIAALSLLPAFAMGGESCPSGIGVGEGTEPVRTFRLNGTSKLLVCGWTERDKKGQVTYSEFELVVAATRESLLRFGAMDEVTIVQSGASLVLMEHRRYPVGKNWSIVRVPFRRHEVTGVGNDIFKKKSSVVFKIPKFTETQFKQIRDKYDRAKEKGYAQGGLPTLVVLAALSGSQEFEALLPNVKVDMRLDGALGEEFAAALDDFREIRNQSNMNAGPVGK